MKISITPTTQVVDLSGVKTRLWEGVTETGTRCQLFVALVAVNKEEPPEAFEAFERELEERKAPATVWPLRMVL